LGHIYSGKDEILPVFLPIFSFTAKSGQGGDNQQQAGEPE
jgi:hypothetical protein